MAGVTVGHVTLVEGDDVRTINAVVAETNDGMVNDIRARPARPDHAASVHLRDDTVVVGGQIHVGGHDREPGSLGPADDLSGL